MKTKVFFLYCYVTLFSNCFLSAQQQGLFYYYKGSPISLSVNSQHFLLYADTSKISKDLFEKEFRVTEWIGDGSNGVLENRAEITAREGCRDARPCVSTTEGHETTISNQKQAEPKEYHVDLQRHIFRLCSTDLAWSGGMARKR